MLLATHYMPRYRKWEYACVDDPLEVIPRDNTRYRRLLLEAHRKMEKAPQAKYSGIRSSTFNVVGSLARFVDVERPS